ncbi:hypothetical protein [Streptomyces sp. NPDC052701]|uniref:hypothetical protein n=1 Tax=Streptomyces sp. NPDC052701 TaxID=3155533 RepID=UPI003431A439
MALKERLELQLQRERLLKAAGVSRVELVCAPATWRVVKQHCQYPFSHFKNFPYESTHDVPDEDGFLHVELEGADLARLVQRTYTARFTVIDAARRAVCRRVWDATGAVLDSIDLDAPDGKQLPPIVLDARLGTS